MIIKRDGRKVKFDSDRIKNALIRCFVEVDGKLLAEDENLISKITNDITNQIKSDISVEEIQDIVETKLMESNRKDAARAYITYRNKRSAIRESKTDLIKTIKDKLAALNVQNQNANVDEKSFGGRKGEADSELMRQIALNYCMSDIAKTNHLNNEIYTHDLDSYAIGCHNCLSIPFDKLLANGFNTRQTDVRPAKSVNTAMQLVAVIFQLQSLQQFGGVSATHLDWTMVPYVRMSFIKHWKDGMSYIEDEKHYQEIEKLVDNSNEWFLSEHPSIEDDIYSNHGTWNRAYDYAYDMTVKEMYQAAEGLFHNLNTLQSRSGNQLPFTSINFGTCTLPEGRLVTKSLLEVSINGIGRLHRTPIFPCSIFQMMKGVNREPGDPNYDLYQLALKSTAQRLYPNYANCDWTGNAGYDKDDPKTYFSTINKLVA